MVRLTERRQTPCQPNGRSATSIKVVGFFQLNIGEPGEEAWIYEGASSCHQPPLRVNLVVTGVCFTCPAGCSPNRPRRSTGARSRGRFTPEAPGLRVTSRASPMSTD